MWQPYLHIHLVKKGTNKQSIMFCTVQIMLDAVEQVKGMFLITADHGNGEDMVKRNLKTSAPILDKEGKVQVLTSHTSNPVRRLHTPPSNFNPLTPKAPGMRSSYFKEIFTLSCMGQ